MCIHTFHTIFQVDQYFCYNIFIYEICSTTMDSSEFVILPGLLREKKLGSWALPLGHCYSVTAAFLPKALPNRWVLILGCSWTHQLLRETPFVWWVLHSPLEPESCSGSRSSCEGGEERWALGQRISKQISQTEGNGVMMGARVNLPDPNRTIPKTRCKSFPGFSSSALWTPVEQLT